MTTWHTLVNAMHTHNSDILKQRLAYQNGQTGRTSTHPPWKLGPQGLAVILDLPLLTGFGGGKRDRLHRLGSVRSFLLCLQADFNTLQYSMTASKPPNAIP